MHFLMNCLQPDAVMMLFVAVISLVGYGFPGYRGRDTLGLTWLLWLIIGILAIVSWFLLVVS
jgi:NADH:ubiquinone oxidoreductase subunit 6 (subunit J)